MKPVNATRRMTMPRTMTGHCKTCTQALSACVASQIPAPMMGIERSKAMKFMAAMTLLLNAIVMRLLVMFCEERLLVSLKEKLVHLEEERILKRKKVKNMCKSLDKRVNQA